MNNAALGLIALLVAVTMFTLGVILLSPWPFLAASATFFIASWRYRCARRDRRV